MAVKIVLILGLVIAAVSVQMFGALALIGIACFVAGIAVNELLSYVPRRDQNQYPHGIVVRDITKNDR